MSGTRFDIRIGPESTVTGVRYPAAGGSRAFVLLAHGAGAGQLSPFMVACGEGLAARGIDAATFDFPYMERRSKVPNPAPQLEACYRAAIMAARDNGWLEARALVIGGKSMGGRMATHLAAAPEALPHPVAGAVLLGYPLHPPGRADRLRAAHLPSIRVPLLFIQGTRDTFGDPDELRAVVGSIPARVTIHPIEGGDHSFKVRGGARGAQAAVLDGILDTVAAWTAAVAGAPGAQPEAGAPRVRRAVSHKDSTR